MNQSSDDSQIQELVQRLKRVDEQSTPDFEDVLGRPVRKPDRRPARRLQLTVVGCTVATVLAAFLFVRLQQNSSHVDSGPRMAEDVVPALPVFVPHDERVLDIDFEHLRRVVEEHFSMTETENGIVMPVWSSRTESLLALNLNVSLTQE